MWLVPPFTRVTRYPVRWLICLLALGALLLAGCDSDDDDTCNISDARVMQVNSVFRVFEAQGDDCFLFTEGLFGNSMPSTTPTQLCFSEIQAEADPPMGRFMTDPDGTQAEGGDVDGAASCNYTYDEAPNTRVPCPLCDIIVNARNVPRGGEGRGTMELHLAGNRDPDTLANPPLRSDRIEVTVGTDAQCNVTSINGVAVTQEPVN